MLEVEYQKLHRRHLRSEIRPRSFHPLTNGKYFLGRSLQVKSSAERNRVAFPTKDKTVSRTMAGNLQYEGLTSANQFFAPDAGRTVQLCSVHFVMQGVPRHETLTCVWKVLPVRRTHGIDGRRKHPTTSSRDFPCGCGHDDHYTAHFRS